MDLLIHHLYLLLSHLLLLNLLDSLLLSFLLPIPPNLLSILSSLFIYLGIHLYLYSHLVYTYHAFPLPFSVHSIYLLYWTLFLFITSSYLLLLLLYICYHYMALYLCFMNINTFIFIILLMVFIVDWVVTLSHCGLPHRSGIWADCVPFWFVWWSCCIH